MTQKETLRVGIGGPVGSGKTALTQRPFVFSNLKTGQGLEDIVRFIETEGLMQ